MWSSWEFLTLKFAIWLDGSQLRFYVALFIKGASANQRTVLLFQRGPQKHYRYVCTNPVHDWVLALEQPLDVGPVLWLPVLWRCQIEHQPPWHGFDGNDIVGDTLGLLTPALRFARKSSPERAKVLVVWPTFENLTVVHTKWKQKDMVWHMCKVYACQTGRVHLLQPHTSV